MTIYQKGSFVSQESHTMVLTEYIFHQPNRHLKICEMHEIIKLNKTHKQYS